MTKEVNGSVPKFAIEQSTIQNIRSRLRKVNTQPKFTETAPAPQSIPKKDDDKNEIYELLKQRVTSMRACLACSDSDDDSDSESSSSSEDF